MDLPMRKFILEHENDNVQTLALRAGLYPDINMEFAIRQIKGRQMAKEKIPSWYGNIDILYPQHLSLEQASSEATARFKASVFNGDSHLDLTLITKTPSCALIMSVKDI